MITSETWDKIADWIRTNCYGFENVTYVDTICSKLAVAKVAIIDRNRLQNGKGELLDRNVAIGTSFKGWFVCSTPAERDMAVQWYRDRIDAEKTNCGKLEKAFEESHHD